MNTVKHLIYVVKVQSIRNLREIIRVLLEDHDIITRTHGDEELIPSAVLRIFYANILQTSSRKVMIECC